MSDDCPECEIKIILNAGVAARILDETCYIIVHHVEAGKEFSNTRKLVDQANKIEDEVNKFRRMVLEGLGFKGPWPKSLS